MKGFILVNGNTIVYSGVGSPAEWTENHVPIKDVGNEPDDLIGKFYNPKSDKIYESYSPRNGKYSDGVVYSSEDLKKQEIAIAENTIEIKACGWMLKFCKDVVLSKKVITANDIPNYVTHQLDTYLGEGNYKI